MKRWGDIALANNMANPDAPKPVTPVTAMPDAAREWLTTHPAPAPASQAIVLPLPPSANRNWRPGSYRMYTPAEVKNYKVGVWLRCQHAGLHPYDGKVAVYLHIYRNVGDSDNYLKVLFDALQGHMYHNDRQIVEHHVWLHDEKENPRVEVDVRMVTA